MKTTFFSILLIIISSCSKNDNSSTNPTPTSQDQLPPATQIGANKVGCLVNGQVFLPYQKNPFGPPAVVCFYQYLNSSFTFSLGISNNKITNGFQNINIASRNVEYQQGNVYQIKLENFFWKFFSIFNRCNLKFEIRNSAFQKQQKSNLQHIIIILSDLS